MDRNEKLSKHFTLGELIRSEIAERKGIDNNPPQDLIPKLRRICEKVLEPIREYYGRLFRPNSGYRSPELNKKIGGSKKSQHCLTDVTGDFG